MLKCYHHYLDQETKKDLNNLKIYFYIHVITVIYDNNSCFLQWLYILIVNVQVSFYSAILLTCM